jgi:hypothetical protein
MANKCSEKSMTVPDFSADRTRYYRYLERKLYVLLDLVAWKLPDDTIEQVENLIFASEFGEALNLLSWAIRQEPNSWDPTVVSKLDELSSTLFEENDNTGLPQ